MFHNINLLIVYGVFFWYNTNQDAKTKKKVKRKLLITATRD